MSQVFCIYYSLSSQAFTISYFCTEDIGKIEYRPDAPADEVLCFRHYNAQEVSDMLQEYMRGRELVFHGLATLDN